MKIFLYEIAEQEKELNFTQEDAWIVKSVLRIDERFEGARPQGQMQAQVRPVQAYLSLRKVDDVIVVSGQINTYVELVCSRCANVFQHSCKPSFSALFCKDPVMAGVAHLPKHHSKYGEGADRVASRPQGQNSGFARHAHNFEDDQDVSEGKDLEITYLSHDNIDLSDVISEQLQLQVPFQPLCKDTCKGICSNCGADLNSGRCACSKIKPNNPLSVLSDFKF
jgi:uncharacterized protein